MTLTEFDGDGGRFEVEARSDALNWPGGSGWRLLAGILQGLGEVVWGGPVRVEEDAAGADNTRRFTVFGPLPPGEDAGRPIRARIGLIVPASNTVCEPDMARLCPPGVTTHAARVAFEPTLEGLKAMMDHAGRAVDELTAEGVSDLIVFCCTVGSMVGGPDYDLEINRRLEGAAGVPVTSTATAVKEALRVLGASRITLVTPYNRPINEREREVLNASGLTVTGMIGYHDEAPAAELKNDMIARLSSEEAYRMALAADGSDADAVFVSCTNFAVLDVIDRLEARAGKPVVTSNQAAMWLALRELGLQDRLPGFGRLFSL
jgi:maleate isomerase